MNESLNKMQSTDLRTMSTMAKDSEPYYLQKNQQVLLVQLITRLGEDEVSVTGSRTPKDAKLKIIDVLTLVLQRTELRQVQALKTILIVLAKQVYDFQTAKLVRDVSEELAIGVLECLAVAKKCASSDTVDLFFQPDNSSQICQIMYAILLLLDQSESRQIKLAALDALMALLHVDDSSDQDDDIVLRHQISGIVFFAVPMIWSSLSRLIFNDPKIGRRVIEVRDDELWPLC